MSNGVNKSTTMPLAAAILFGLFGVLAIVGLSMVQKEGAEIRALVFPPSYKEDQVAAAVFAADGKIIRFGATSNMVVASFKEKNNRTVLNQTGAVAALDPQSVEGCSITNKMEEGI
ncbi:MAG: hypothetical protein R3261_02585 [Alphaproteobacteria bacterium]|nr:hypothetical protein [Alphaproteobacteria bacterium]